MTQVVSRPSSRRSVPVGRLVDGPALRLAPTAERIAHRDHGPGLHVLGDAEDRLHLRLLQPVHRGERGPETERAGGEEQVLARRIDRRRIAGPRARDHDRGRLPHVGGEVVGRGEDRPRADPLPGRPRRPSEPSSTPRRRAGRSAAFLSVSVTTSHRATWRLPPEGALLAASMIVQRSSSETGRSGSSRRMARVVRNASKSSIDHHYHGRGTDAADASGPGPTLGDPVRSRLVCNEAVRPRTSCRDYGERPAAGSAPRRRGRRRGVDLHRLTGPHRLRPVLAGGSAGGRDGRQTALLRAQQDRPCAPGPEHPQHRDDRPVAAQPVLRRAGRGGGRLPPAGRARPGARRCPRALAGRGPPGPLPRLAPGRRADRGTHRRAREHPRPRGGEPLDPGGAARLRRGARMPTTSASTTSSGSGSYWTTSSSSARAVCSSCPPPSTPRPGAPGCRRSGRAPRNGRSATRSPSSGASPPTSARRRSSGSWPRGRCRTRSCARPTSWPSG